MFGFIVNRGGVLLESMIPSEVLIPEKYFLKITRACHLNQMGIINRYDDHGECMFSHEYVVKLLTWSPSVLFVLSAHNYLFFFPAHKHRLYCR